MDQKQLTEMTVNTIRFKRYSLATERAYLAWLKGYWSWCKNHSSLPTEEKIKSFLTYLAVQKRVSARTQSQALNAVVFFYRHVVKVDIGDFSAFLRSKKPRTLPEVLSQEEIARVLPRMKGVHLLIASLMYGCGFRLTECLTLRIQNVDFYRSQITVKRGKGDKDRVLQMPERVKAPLQAQMDYAKQIWLHDKETGHAGVALPDAIDRKYPNADKEWGWFWVFPSANYSTDPRSGIYRRHHIDDSPFQKALKNAARAAGVHKKVSSHILRHSFATHSLENGKPIHELQQEMGHKDLTSTQIYLHVMTKPCDRYNPLDLLAM